MRNENLRRSPENHQIAKIHPNYNMNNKIIIYCISVAALLTVSCKNHTGQSGMEKSSENLTVKWDAESLRDISTIIEDVSYIPIETHSDGLFNSERITKLMIADEKILILERVGTGALLMFDMNGRFERRIGKRGQGPGEYTMIMAFTADDNYLYILDAPRKSVLIYDYSGNYIRELKTEKHPYDIAVLDNGDFLLAYHIQPKRMESAYRIEILDKDMNLKKELFPMNETDSEIGMDYYFVHSGDKITYQNYIQDTVVVFDAGNGNYNFIGFDFNNKVPEELRSGLDFGNRGYQFLGNNTAVTVGKYLVFTVSMRAYVLDTEQGYIYSNGKYPVFDMPQAGYKGKIATTVNGRYYRQAIKHDIWPKAPEKTHEYLLKDDENTALMLYKFK